MLTLISFKAREVLGNWIVALPDESKETFWSIGVDSKASEVSVTDTGIPAEDNSGNRSANARSEPRVMFRGEVMTNVNASG
jgi:hypothetical protein